jgi:lipopolysaccharide/colanic/teichoic acid biosynthesis glycosyltransferase
VSSEIIPIPYGFAYQERRAYRASSRLIDIVISATALTIFSPILIAAAIAIKLDDGGSVFFVQRRVGRFGKLFPMVKLRTMHDVACGDAAKPRSGTDPRITRVGRHLRRLSIDELPQLFNVLRGEMTLVGPRPEMPFLVQQYAAWQQLRHIVTPGITGLWQVTCRSTVALQRPEATALDVEYITRESVANDLGIILKTVGSLVSTRGAH